MRAIAETIEVNVEKRFLMNKVKRIKTYTKNKYEK